MSERKNKFVGLRMYYDDYMCLLSHTQTLGVSTTDFLMSLILPAISAADKQVKSAIEKDTTTSPPQNIFVKQSSNNKNSFQTKRKLLTANDLFPEEYQIMYNQITKTLTL